MYYDPFSDAKKKALCPIHILETITEHTRSAEFKSKIYPKTINELPLSHYLVKLAINAKGIIRPYELVPFVSPSTLMKLYNKEFAIHNYTMTEVYYHYENIQENTKFQDMTQHEIFHFIRDKNTQNQPQQVQDVKNQMMDYFLNSKNIHRHQNQKIDFGYVILKEFFPLIAINILKTSKNQNKTESKYILLRLDSQKCRFLNGIPRQFATKDVICKTKKQTINKNEQVKPKDLFKREELRKRYNIKNFSIGWFEKTQPQIMLQKQNFNAYFDIKNIEQNLSNRHYQNKKIFNYLFLRKNPHQTPKIQIFSILFNQVILKWVIKLSDIKKIEFLVKNKQREMYFSLKKQPQYFVHLIQYNVGQSIFSLRPWERVQNFPVFLQENLNSSLFFNNMISTGTVMFFDFATSKSEFNQVIKYFQAQDLIECQSMNQSPQHSIVDKYTQSYVFQLEKKFNQFFSKVQKWHKIKVHHIKFSLFSLKSFYGAQVTFEDLVKLLEQIEKQGFDKINQHNTALKMLCIKPHELLSKPFEAVYTKMIKKLEFWDKIRQKYPEMGDSQLLKLEDMLQMQSFDDISGIEQMEEVSLNIIANTELMKVLSQKVQTIKLILLPRIKITPNGIVYAGWTKEVANKVLKHYKDYEYQFLKCEIRNQDDQQIKNSPYLLQHHIRKQITSVPIMKEFYLPLGWSQSQLREGILWYTLDSDDIKTVKRQEILEFLGDFNEQKHPHLKNPALKAARIGQNFGSSWSFDATQINFIYQDDIFADVQKKKNFSDGVGCISMDLMQHFKEQLKLQNLSAIQIRYKGIKGLLSVNKSLPQNTALIRRSMVKYDCNHPDSVKYFDIIEASRYKVGYLNRQIILLLVENGVNSEYIYDLQKEYVDQLANHRILQVMLEYIVFDDENEEVFERENDKMFESIGEVLKMILPKSQLHKEDKISKTITELSFFKALRVEAKRKLIEPIKQKARIRVQKSVRLFGVLDEFKVLNEYEVYCSIQKPKDKKYNITGKCVLTKNPCMHPSDLRVVTCVSDKEIQRRLKQKGKDPTVFEELLNVIVFPQQGKTPLTMEISQSDLDGDEFFLAWDQRIVPKKNLPAFILANEVKIEERPHDGAGYNEMLDFFVEYLNFHQLGRLSNSHLIFGDLKGASCAECIELCMYHSIAVQYPKRGYRFTVPKQLFYHKYPNFMEKELPLKSYYSSSILGKVYNSSISLGWIKNDRNDFQIFSKSKETFQMLIGQILDLKQMRDLGEKVARRGQVRVNDILEKYLPDYASEFQYFDRDQLKMNENQEPDIANNAKDQEIQNQKFFTRKMTPFSIKTLKSIQKFIEVNPQARSLDQESPFSLIEILTAFNYLCIYQYELDSLVNFIDGQKESSYTVYFELHTSSQNNRNPLILERINEFRKKWFYFFAQELITDGVLKRVQDFEQMYFKDLIEKKPQFQDTVKTLNKMNGNQKRQNFQREVNLIINEFEDCNPQFIKDEIDSRKIIKKNNHYETFRFMQLRDLNPLILRKMVLYYIVSTHFDRITSMQKISKLIDSYSEYQRPTEGLSFARVSSRSVKFEELREALKIFSSQKADMQGFCWFCIPKLMIVWWIDVIKRQQIRANQNINRQIDEKQKEKSKYKKYKNDSYEQMQQK